MAESSILQVTTLADGLYSDRVAAAVPVTGLSISPTDFASLDNYIYVGVKPRPQQSIVDIPKSTAWPLS